MMAMNGYGCLVIGTNITNGFMAVTLATVNSIKNTGSTIATTITITTTTVTRTGLQ